MEGDVIATPSVAVINNLLRQLFPRGPRYVVERVTEGVSTFVYRLTNGDQSCYLRVLPEVGSTFVPEVRIYELLREHGVLVPEVICYEPYVASLGLSVMVTTTIPGQSLAHQGLDVASPAILAAAGQDLALINSLEIAGFGWIDRDSAQITALRAGHPSDRAFRTEYFERDLALLGRGVWGVPKLPLCERSSRGMTPGSIKSRRISRTATLISPIFLRTREAIAASSISGGSVAPTPGTISAILPCAMGSVSPHQCCPRSSPGIGRSRRCRPTQRHGSRSPRC